jgi:F-type H+-transporting ATPase subunit epsilon
MQLEVLTPQRTALNADVDEVTVPGLAGEFGVLPGHTPFLTACKAGTLSWRGKSGAGSLQIGDGYCEVDGKDKIVVLTQSAEKPTAPASS